MHKSIKFCVKKEGEDMRPPKKRGRKSMWGNTTEAPRLLALRKAAKDKMKACGYEKPFTGKIRLTLCVYVGSQDRRNSGDLDNFITGVCDGLMAAHRNIRHREQYWDSSFREGEDESLCPSEPIAYNDDSQMKEIYAKKVEDAALGDACWYKVKLEERPS